jgi:hypothetical protein
MNHTRATATSSEEPIFIVGISGRIPLRTMYAFELTGSAIPAAYRHWNTLLRDRLQLSATAAIPHPRRIVKGGHILPFPGFTATSAQAWGQHHYKQLILELSELPRPLVLHLPKQSSPQAEQSGFDALRPRLAGRYSGLVLMDHSRGITWYRLTSGSSAVEALLPDAPALKALPCLTSEAELLLAPAKLAAYDAYQRRISPSVDRTT